MDAMQLIMFFPQKFSIGEYLKSIHYIIFVHKCVFLPEQEILHDLYKILNIKIIMQS